MAQALPVIKKGNSLQSPVYQFGDCKTLTVYPDGNADICDAKTGQCLRPIRWEGVRVLGYCPFKLLAGNASD